MKKLISFFFFIPLFIYLFIALLNPTILFQTSDISLFWFFQIKQVPILAYTVVFFASYIVIIWLLLKFSDIFSNIQKSKLENEVNRLKANLQDGQGNILNDIKTEFWKILEKSQIETKQTIDIFKKENEKIISQLNYEIKGLKEKVDLIKK
jgi:hypothetical protein